MKRIIALAIVLATVLAACGGSGSKSKGSCGQITYKAVTATLTNSIHTSSPSVSCATARTTMREILAGAAKQPSGWVCHYDQQHYTVTCKHGSSSVRAVYVGRYPAGARGLKKVPS